MWDAIFQLERAKNTSPQMAVLLMTCYGLVGACENMVDLFQAVSIKHLQIETIGLVKTICLKGEMVGLLLNKESGIVL